jgi:D-cysteine desulfhydrase
MITESPKVIIQWHNEFDLQHSQLVELLKRFGDLLPNPLSARVDLQVYATKLLTYADIACAFMEGEIIAFLAIYANDEKRHKAYLPILAILKEFQGSGLGKIMMSRALARARQRGMKSMDLGVKSENISAHRLYRYCGFRFERTQGHRRTMCCELPVASSIENPTPLIEHSRLLAKFGFDIDLRIKRDDLYPMAGGGVEARKIGYIMRDLIANGHDVIVTNGGPQSNHARAAAVLSAQLGIKCHIVVVLEPRKVYRDTGNILLMRLSGATIEFCSKEQLASCMDQAVGRFQTKGYNPVYVWGGGHCLAATIAFIDAANEAQSQCGEWQPNYLVFASGTGTTQAGLAIGYAGKSTRVIGISVARDTERGTQVINECISEYFNCIFPHKRSTIEIDFRDEWTDGGYEKTSFALLDVIARAAQAGCFVDPTYSGKALRGLKELVERGEIPQGSKVLFWHTGGLMNLLASDLSGNDISL